MQKPFKAEQFTPTEFYSAEVKAKFGNDLVKFILNGFQYKDFSKSVYQHLRNCFGHIAHYNQPGFFNNWFSDTEKIQKWLDWIIEKTPVGSPSYTFSDVERAIQSWSVVNQAEIQSVISNYGKKENALAEQAGTEVEFAIAAISSNSGSFGHKEYIVLGRNGVCFKGHRQPSENAPGNKDLKKGDTFIWEVDADGMPRNWIEWFETAYKMPDQAPQAVIDEAFAQKIIPERGK